MNSQGSRKDLTEAVEAANSESDVGSDAVFTCCKPASGAPASKRFRVEEAHGRCLCSLWL